MRRDTMMRYLTGTALAFALTACGGGSSAPADENNTTQPPATPTAQDKGLVVCRGTDQGFGLATVLEAGKEVKGLENNPSIRLWHLSDGTHKACVTEGSVEVL